MSDKIVAALITGVLGFLGGFFSNKVMQNNTTSIYVNGEKTVISSEKYESIYNENLSLKQQNNELSEHYDNIIQEYIDKFEAAESTIQKTNAQITVLKRQNKDLEDLNINLSSENEELNANNTNLKSKNTALESLLENPPSLSYSEQSSQNETAKTSNSSKLLCNQTYIIGHKPLLFSIEKDNFGEEQKNVIFSCDNTYFIDKKYSTISGILFIPERCKNYGKPHIKIWGDDNQLYDMTLKPGDPPLDFSVDISGVSQLRVETYQNTGVAECFLN